MKEYNLNEKNAGITLIALVVTIIVILILAGISISMLIGQNGILNKAVEAREKTEKANRDEQRKLAQAEALMSTGKTTYKGVTLPEGFAPTKIVGEDSIDDGLVITDGYGNEYVWVEVPKTTEVYPTAGLGITNFTDEEYEKIENDLHTYTSDYRNGTDYYDTYAPDTTTGWFIDEKEYNNAKNKMLKSVYQNGGFWIGRYEAGSEVCRTSSEDVAKIPTSKKNMYPYNYVTRTEAKRLSEKVTTGTNYTSSLLFGVQWDLTLKYIEDKTIANSSDSNTIRSEIKYELISDSSKWGNYCNSEFKINNGKYLICKGWNFNEKWNDYNESENEYVEKQVKKKQSLGNGILLTTGASNEISKQNIYELAGNLWEWTLEYSNDRENPSVSRSGSFDGEGGSIPSNIRNSNKNDNEGIYGGFRISIY